MSSIKLQAPPGMTEFVDERARSFKVAADGSVTVDPTVHDLAPFFRAGFVQQPHLSGTTATRPTATYSGQPYYDMSIDRPIWRNAANTGWIDAAGAAR
jgi:hypothetical protein